MLGEPHDLGREFPEHREAIARLRHVNPEFTALAGEYERLDREIRVLEELGQPRPDVVMEDLKKRRAFLKDRVYEILIASR